MEHQRTQEPYPAKWKEKPFFDLTVELLNSVRDHDFERLSHICDDDFGIVDINPEGGSQIIRNSQQWEEWFQGLFTELKNRGAVTWSEITRYEAFQKGEMGYSVVDFDQIFLEGSQKLKFPVLATIIWKKEGNGWRESRYHSSLVGSPRPVEEKRFGKR